MSKIEKVKEIMGLGENFHMCDVSEIAEDHIHLESWDEDVNKSDFDLVAELIADDYLELCVEKRIEPEKAYKGSFNVRISPDLHRSIAIHAIQDGMTLNKYVEEALQNAISAT